MASQFVATPFVEQLIHAGSHLGRQLAASMETPLRQYLRALIPPEHTSPPNRHLLLLAHAMERYLTERGDSDITSVCDALLHRPVIQQADHSNLLLDTETFLNNLLFHAAAREAGVRVAITSQCSTVACLSRREPVGGPVFLWTRGGCFQLFDYSKRQLKNSSFCALPMPTRFAIRAIQGQLSDVLGDPVLSALDGRAVSDPADAFRSVNAELWQGLRVDHSIRRVAVDERLASEALALQIEQRDGPIFRLIFDPPVRDAFVRTKQRLVRSRLNIAVNRAEPDFFWRRKDSQLRALILSGSGPDAEFRMEGEDTARSITIEPLSVVTALRSGNLYGDRILAYSVRCLFPGAVAVGGTVQQDYVDLYRKILLDTHAEEHFLSDDEVRTISNANLTRLGGAPLVELDQDATVMFQWLKPGDSLDAFEDSVLDLPLGQTIGRMDCAWFYQGLLSKQAGRET